MSLRVRPALPADAAAVAALYAPWVTGSPADNPIRTRNGSVAVSLWSATSRWIWIAHSIARTTEMNDAMIPSPAWSTSLPACS